MRSKILIIFMICLFNNLQAQKANYSYNFGIKTGLNINKSFNKVGYTLGFTNCYNFNKTFLKSDILFGNKSNNIIESNDMYYFALISANIGGKKNTAPGRYIAMEGGLFVEYPYDNSSLVLLHVDDVLDFGIDFGISYQIRKFVFGSTAYFNMVQSFYSKQYNIPFNFSTYCIFRFT